MSRSSVQHLVAFVIVVLLAAGVWYRRSQLPRDDDPSRPSGRPHAGAIPAFRVQPLPDDAPARLVVSALGHEVMGTEVTIVVGADDEDAARRHLQQAFDEIARLEGMMSHRIDTSDVSRFNRAETGQPIPIPGEMVEVIALSQQVAHQTDGAFDITVKPLIDLYRTTRGRPTDEQLQQARSVVGYRKLTLEADAGTLTKTVDGVQLDLGGIAKGAIVDHVVQVLADLGYRHIMVNAGGDIACRGGHPAGRPWSVGIQWPQADAERLLGVVHLSVGAVVTSGNYQRFTMVEGKRRSHILDPRTGHPADALPSVTVRAPTAARADALATALSVMGLERGMALVNRTDDVEALLVEYDGTRPTPHRSTGFEYEATEQ